MNASGVKLLASVSLLPSCLSSVLLVDVDESFVVHQVAVWAAVLIINNVQLV